MFVQQRNLNRSSNGLLEMRLVNIDGSKVTHKIEINKLLKPFETEWRVEQAILKFQTP